MGVGSTSIEYSTSLSLTSRESRPLLQELGLEPDASAAHTAQAHARTIWGGREAWVELWHMPQPAGVHILLSQRLLGGGQGVHSATG